jgi:hypothetical protein
VGRLNYTGLTLARQALNPTVLFALGIFEIRFCFIPRLAWTLILSIVGMTGTHHCAQLLVEAGSHENFLLGLASAMTLPISASQVDRITGLSHLTWPDSSLLCTD